MHQLLFSLLALLPISSEARTRQTMTCGGVTIYSDFVREDGVARLTMEYRSLILGRRKPLWGWGGVQRDTKDPWVVTAWAEFTRSDTVLAEVRTRRTVTGDLVADIDWSFTENDRTSKTDVPCVLNALPPPTLGESCMALLFKEQAPMFLLHR